MSDIPTPEVYCADYWQRMSGVMSRFDWTPVSQLGHELLDCWKSGRQVFMAGNGGSAGNAVHLANDYLYAMSKRAGSGLRVHAHSSGRSDGPILRPSGGRMNSDARTTGRSPVLRFA